MKRDAIAKIIYEPYFEKAVKRHFVRVSIGEAADGRQVYVLARVVGVSEAPHSYTLQYTEKSAQRGKAPKRERLTCRTRKLLNCRVGDSTKPFRVAVVSNQQPTQVISIEM